MFGFTGKLRGLVYSLILIGFPLGGAHVAIEAGAIGGTVAVGIFAGIAAAIGTILIIDAILG